jgi:transcriptional regulator with XRE-family HTH domain
MSMAAAAAYLRKLRELRHMTQGELARAIGVHKRTIERLEQRAETIAANTFLNIVAVLEASADQVTQLAIDSTATIHDAEELASAWFNRDSAAKHLPAAEVQQNLDPRLHMPPGVRVYLRTLRERVKYPMRALEILTSLSSEEWLAWEEGRIADVPNKAFFIIIADLNGSFDNILKLIETNASKEQGRQLAEQWMWQRTKSQSIPISDEMDVSLIKHTRFISQEQKQRVLEYAAWIETELVELQMNVEEATRHEHNRARFAQVSDLTQQLIDLLDQTSWIETNRWLWHAARLHDLRKEAYRRAPNPELERAQRALDEVSNDYRDHQAKNRNPEVP